MRRLRPKPPPSTTPPPARVALDATKAAAARVRQLEAIAEAAIALAQSDGVEPKDRAAALDVARRAVGDQEHITRGEPARRLERGLVAAQGSSEAIRALASSTATTAPTLSAAQQMAQRRDVARAQKAAKLAEDDARREALRRARELGGRPLTDAETRPGVDVIASLVRTARTPQMMAVALRAQAERARSGAGKSQEGLAEADAALADLEASEREAALVEAQS